MLNRLVQDKTGKLEMEIRFGHILKNQKKHFQTSVDGEWFLKVQAYLQAKSEMIFEETVYTQYKMGRRRVRVFSNTKTETTRKKVVSNFNIAFPGMMDIRVSLSSEEKDEVIDITHLKPYLVHRQSYQQGDIRFDLTKTEKSLKTFPSVINRVELEISNLIDTQTNISLLSYQVMVFVREIIALSQTK